MLPGYLLFLARLQVASTFRKFLLIGAALMEPFVQPIDRSFCLSQLSSASGQFLRLKIKDLDFTLADANWPITHS